MYRLTDAYENGSTATFFSVFVGVSISMLFTVVMAFVFNAHNSKLSKQLSATKNDLNSLASKTDASYESLSINGESSFGGDINADSNLTVGGDTTITGNLDVSSKAKIDTLLGVNGDTTLNDSLSVLGKTELKGSLDVAGATILQSGMSVTGDSSLGKDLTVTGKADIAGALDVAEAGTFRSSLSVGGDTTFGGGVTIASAANFSGSLDIVGSTAFQSSLNVGGDSSIDASQSGSATGVAIQGSAAFGGDLSVVGVTAFASTLTAGTVDSTATFDGTATTNGVTTLLSGSNPSFTVQSGVTLGGDLQQNGITLFNGSLTQGTADSTATFDGTATTTTVSGNTTTVATSLLGSGGATFKVQNAATTFNGDLSVTGTADLGGALTVGTAGSGSNDVSIDATWIDASAGNATKLLGTTTLNVQSSATLYADLSVRGVASFAGLTVGSLSTGDNGNSVDIDGTGLSGTILSVTALTTLNNTSLSVTGDTTLAGLTINNSPPTSADADSSFDVTGNLTVSGATAIVGAVTAGGGLLQGLSVSGLATFEDLNVTSALVNGVQVGGNVVADGIQAKTIIHSLQYTVMDANGVGVGAGGGVGVSFTETSSAASTQGVDPTTDPTNPFNCQSTSKHIHIYAITAGIVTSALCADDTTAGGDQKYDLAEKFPSTQVLSAGDVVAIDPSNSEYVVKTASVHDDAVIGVVSTDPGYTLGSGGAGYPIALAGRVPVKVTDEGGSIAPGDYLTSSSTPGYAKKAAPGEKTIGQALESFVGSIGTVKMFVNVSPNGTQMQSILQSTDAITQGSTANLASLNVSGPTTLSDLTVTGTATINNLQVSGQTTVASLSVNGHILGNVDTRGNVTIPQGAQSIHHTFTNPYDQAPTVVASPTNQAVLYIVNSTTTGFDIKLPSPATADTNFNYLVQE